jgi:hypothetical protein
LKIFLTKFGATLPLTLDPPVICFWKWIRWKDYGVPKNRNLEIVSAKNELFFSPTSCIPTLRTRVGPTPAYPESPSLTPLRDPRVAAHPPAPCGAPRAPPPRCSPSVRAMPSPDCRNASPSHDRVPSRPALKATSPVSTRSPPLPCGAPYHYASLPALLRDRPAMFPKRGGLPRRVAA